MPLDDPCTHAISSGVHCHIANKLDDVSLSNGLLESISMSMGLDTIPQRLSPEFRQGDEAQ